MNREDNTLAWIWASLLGRNNEKIRKVLINQFGSIENAWCYCAKYNDFTCKKIDEDLRKKLSNIDIFKKAEKIYLEICKNGYKVITLDSIEYPFNLKNIYSPPCVLYYCGNLPQNTNNEPENYVSIVGSRKCTTYGKTNAFNFAKNLSEHNIGIVSGLARGIDSEAHKGALWGNGYTIAVLGSGIDVIYPKESLNIYHKIAETGCILSEYPPGTPPFKNNFPARNRIVAGISKGVLIVEAALKSGAMITVDMALEQGKNVYVVPGNINSDLSGGCNELIKNGATCVTSYIDILQDLNINFNELSSISISKKAKMHSLNDIQTLIFTLVNKGCFSADLIADESGLDISIVLSALTMMEIEGILLKDFDGFYRPVI